MTARADNPGYLTPPRRVGVLIAAIAFGVLLVVLLVFCVTWLYVGRTQGTVGMVENLEAPRESWHVVPAAGADVLIIWTAQVVDARFDARSTCVRTVLMRTNARGEFSVGSWWLKPAWPPQVDGHAEAYVYKQGYTMLADRSHLRQYRAHTHILGPPTMNPWTGVLLPDEDPAKARLLENCPPLERL